MKIGIKISDINLSLNGNNDEIILPSKISSRSKLFESLGFDFVTSHETTSNPFLPLSIASEATNKLDLLSSIALAFVRSPMDLAYIAWDLQRMSKGRLYMGLGSQVRGHIVRRFSMPWSAPAPRMREYVIAMKHIWDCWQNGTKLSFSGDHYSFNLMSPFFNPGPIDDPDIRVSIAGVNPNMLKVAGELCDGVILHSFNTQKYTQNVVLPNLQAGAERTGRSIEDIEISGGGFIVTGSDEEELEKNKIETKSRISFYASTRSYADVMREHGWNDTHEKLYRMSIEGEWNQMGAEITDEMLGHFAVVGTHDQIADKIKSTYGRYASSVSFNLPVKTVEDEEVLRGIISDLSQS